MYVMTNMSNSSIRASKKYFDLFPLGEELTDREDAFRLWRFRHATTVERIIGFISAAPVEPAAWATCARCWAWCCFLKSGGCARIYKGNRLLAH